MNAVTLFGHIGQAPELRETKAGPVLSIRLATNERIKAAGGEWKDHTEWHTVSVWGKRATALGKLLRKGTPVLVHGHLRTTSYDKDGTKHYRTQINADDVTLTERIRREPADEDAPYTEEYAGG